jgi:hypothetical protein
MTGRMVERAAQAAYRSAPVRPTGARSLMPPHSQGAERRTAHRAGHTGSRWGLRALVIGGLAGAAWLLTGAAAHAADRDPAVGGISLGTSLIGSVVHGDDHSIPVVDRVLKAAVKPLEPDHHHRSSSHTDADSAPSGIIGVVREPAAPLRPVGVAVDAPEPVPDQVAEVQEPEPPQAVTASVTRVNPPGPAPDRSVPDQLGQVVHRDDRVPAAELEPARRHPVGKTVTRQHKIAVDRHPAAVTTAEAETVSETPGGDGPAPLRVHLGAANGVPASGPGTAMDGGSAAFLPARVADSTVAYRRLPIATDVEVRRHDAEAPTVSPD